MKAVILAGGLGTRLSEETVSKPKPMVEIGTMPVLWHIMKIYSAHGVNEFVVCCGYKGYMIKEYFANYFLHQSDVTFSLVDNSMKVHDQRAEPWQVSLIDTGEDAMTGARLRKVLSYVDEDDEFCFTYGDGVGNVDISTSIEFHRSHGRLATMTATFPPGRFGALEISESGIVTSFKEKPKGDGARINGGFFVLSPKVRDYLTDDDNCVWEQEPLMQLASDGQLAAFNHDGFWQPMDTLRDRRKLEELWHSGEAPWKVWD